MGRHKEDDAVNGQQEVRLVELNRYHLGEMADDERTRFESRLDATPGARARLEQVRVGQAAALERLDIAVDSVQILARLEATEHRSNRWWRIGAPLLLAAAAAIAVVPLTTAPQGPTTRTKGIAPALEMYVNDADGPRRVEDGVRLGEGDAIQFRYRADGRGYLFVLSIDGRGAISPLYPDVATKSIAIEPNGTHVLEGSVILDDAVGPERIFAVFSEEPVSFEDLEAKLRGAADVTALPRIGIERDDVVETSVLIIKE